MSDENIKLTTIIKPDIRNPFSKLVFKRMGLATQYDPIAYSENQYTKESIVRMFRNITHSQFMHLSISSKEIQLMHTLQGLFTSQATIDELEIIAETPSEFELRVDTSMENQIKQAASTQTLATLKLPRTQIIRNLPVTDFGGSLSYLVTFQLSGGSALVAN